jgi:hypothetical protein
MKQKSYVVTYHRRRTGITPYNNMTKINPPEGGGFSLRNQKVYI